MPQSIVDRLKQPEISQDEVLQYLHHDAALVRVNAIEAAARLARKNADLIPTIVIEAKRPQNAVRLLGTTTVAHVAVGCLLGIGTQPATDAAMRLISEWAENQRDDLLWYLESEGLIDDAKK